MQRNIIEMISERTNLMTFVEWYIFMTKFKRKAIENVNQTCAIIIILVHFWRGF